MDFKAYVPELKCEDEMIRTAFLIAVGDILGNVHTYTKGLVEKPAPCIMAGMDYPDTWVRDASINVTNAGFMLSEDVRKNTLLSCVHRIDGKYRIVHEQTWDCVIWSIGAWNYYCESRDEEFGRLAYEVICDSLEYYEATELDSDGLFCGPGVYADGVAGYPDKYGVLPSYASAIARWGKEHPEAARKNGLGIPMKTLSTNCVYVYAYETAAKLAEIFECSDLKKQSENKECRVAQQFKEKARSLREKINEAFWNPSTGRYDYIKDECDSAEGIGLAFSLLWDIADKERAALVAKNTPVTENGIACLYPTFERYSKLGGFGRHSGTVWPFINAYWALAMKKNGNGEAFDSELFGLAKKAVRDMHFTEIYHPVTGEPYGGLQEVSMHKKIMPWNSCRKQTWSATGFVSMIVDGIFGRRLTTDSITFKPYLPKGIDELTLSGFRYGNAELTIHVCRKEKAGADYPGEITLPFGCGSQTVDLVAE